MGFARHGSGFVATIIFGLSVSDPGEAMTVRRRSKPQVCGTRDVADRELQIL